MKFEHGTFEFENGIIISFWQTITEIFRMDKFNWSTYQFIRVEFENERSMHNMSLTLVFLCCGVRIMIPTYPTEEHEVHKKVKRALFDLKKSCHGYTVVNGWNDFRKMKRDAIVVYRIKTKDKGRMKKLFIQ
jgi:hypothetical protein